MHLGLEQLEQRFARRRLVQNIRPWLIVSAVVAGFCVTLTIALDLSTVGPFPYVLEPLTPGQQLELARFRNLEQCDRAAQLLNLTCTPVTERGRSTVNPNAIPPAEPKPLGLPQPPSSRLGATRFAGVPPPSPLPTDAHEDTAQSPTAKQRFRMGLAGTKQLAQLRSCFARARATLPGYGEYHVRTWAVVNAAGEAVDLDVRIQPGDWPNETADCFRRAFASFRYQGPFVLPETSVLRLKLDVAFPPK